MAHIAGAFYGCKLGFLTFETSRCRNAKGLPLISKTFEASEAAVANMRPKSCAGMARELSLTARVFRAQEAKAMGLVTEVFADAAALQAATMKCAVAIAAKSPLAVTGTKRVLLHSRSVS